ncbi:hypothetical protein ADL00_30505 [Streptomyces sp. AS58]|uniref:Peptidase M23 n=1 Tax=Streptomyces cadmiisoli TaxID=2184053 RepID=A0A2Z4IS53_9ACTN|nr:MULTISPECIES: peptidase inhibitor family I36 protein [Streptomyces]AWW35458.1 hypothetical protein DN051_01160 [Streptomyces cadmiisoli]KOV54465.1 hypothetical protein ADL00_30505 [Streptomyces sp. AS58]
MKKKLAMIMAPALSAVAIAVAGAGPSSASDADVMAYNCQDNEVCFYQHANYTGSVFVPNEMKAGKPVLDFAGRTFTNGASANNAVSSIRNMTGWKVCFYEAPRMQNYYGSVPLDDQLDFGNRYANDAISSASYC